MNAKKLYFGFLGTLVILVGAGAAAYYLASTTIQTKTVSLQQKLAQESVVDEQVEQLRTTQKQFEKLQPILPSIEKALPKAKKQSEITLQLQQLANNNGMSIPSFNFLDSAAPSATSQTIQAGNILALPISFQLTGNYDQFQNFLKALENLDRYTAVTNVSINRGDTKLRMVTFNLTVNVYVKP